MVRHTLKGLGPQVLATRMVPRLRHPALHAGRGQLAHGLAADGYAAAKQLASWRIKVLGAWPAVTVRHVESTGVGDTPELGATLSLRAEVDLAGLIPRRRRRPGRVRAGGRDQRAARRADAAAGVRGDGDGLDRWEGTVPLERTGAFGYTVRVLPKNTLLATEAELGVVTVAS